MWRMWQWSSGKQRFLSGISLSFSLSLSPFVFRTICYVDIVCIVCEGEMLFHSADVMTDQKNETREGQNMMQLEKFLAFFKLKKV